PPRPRHHAEGWPVTLVLCNAAQVVCVARRGERALRGSAMRDAAVLKDASVVLRDGRIDWVGPTAELPGGLHPPLASNVEGLDATGKVVLPGLVDSHTHLIFAGSREDEFEQRLRGRTYQEIAAAGGGINATVRRVRAASKEELKALARRRLRRLLGFGVTTV